MVRPAPSEDEDPEPPSRRQQYKGPRTLRWIALAIFAWAAAAIWHFNFNPFRPRTLRIKVYSDLSFRQGRDWQRIVRSRLEEVSRMYRDAARIEFDLVSIDSADPAAGLGNLEQRRRNLLDKEHGSEDLILCLTSVREPDRSASVVAFSHAAIVSDTRNDSERANTLRLAHELGHLFGAEHEAGTLMADPPENDRFSPRALTLLRALKRYDFASGVNALNSSFGERAVSALTEAGSGLVPMPDANAHRLLAHSFLADGQVGPAVNHLRQALQFNPKNADIRLELASALAHDSQQQEALKILQEGVNGDPRDITLRAGMAGLLGQLNRPIQALEEINQAIRIEPNKPELHVVRATILANEPGFIELGIAGFETALKLNPSLEVAHKWLQIGRATKDKALDEAKKFREEIRLNPQSAEAHYNLASMELRAGELESARQEFLKAAGLNPGDGQCHVNLALINFIRRDYQSAAGELQKARECGISPPAELVDGVERKVVP